MTTRNLSALFEPRSIALFGASNRSGSVGAVAARNLLNAGFQGRIMFVNPREIEIAGQPCFRTTDELPEVPDLAVIATPPDTLTRIIQDLGAVGCNAAVVITGGVRAEVRADMLAAARPHLLRILGPNCLGFLSPTRGVNASFAQDNAIPGSLALLSQSGAVGAALLDWANGKGIGFSHLLSLGDMADIDFGDLLDYLAFDAATKAILMYAENITFARKFMSAARIASRIKPVIMVKAGRSAEGARAAASHTGAMAGADIVYDAALRRAGLIRVDTLQDLFDAAETLATGMRPSSDQLTILTNGGGLGVMATDELARRGGHLARLTDTTRQALDTVLPASWSRGNPIDIIGDATGERYAAALSAIMSAPTNDAILVANCPTGVTDSSDSADALLAAHAAHPERPLIACWMGERTAAPVRRRLLDRGVPAYDTPEAAVAAFQRLVERDDSLRLLLEAPQASGGGGAPDRVLIAREIIGLALDEGRSLLTEPESKRLLAAYGVPVVETRSVTAPNEAKAAATSMKGPYVLKILSRAISHKTDVGGVRLDLQTPDDVGDAAEAMLKDVARHAPGAAIDGFTVQPMVRRPRAQELILGIATDATFGRSILFGHGGVSTEIVADRVMGLPPLNDILARDMIARTKVSRLLNGFRDRPPADLPGIVRVLLALSDMASEIAELAELDINPLLADADGVVALDARVAIARATGPAEDRLAIRPFPAALARQENVGGVDITIRPIRPEDASRLVAMGAATAPADLRLRFHGAVHSLDPSSAARLSQIDYDREMALVAVAEDDSLSGVVRLVFDPEFSSAEVALFVRTDAQDKGLGRSLLRSALDYARLRGASLVWGDVLRENQRMLDMAEHFEARRLASDAGATAVRIEFLLSPPGSA